MTATQSHLERECKLAGSPGFEVPDLAGVDDGLVDEGVVAVALPEQRLDATYYDTADLRLARAGISVRFRTGEADGAEGKWTVKLPEGDQGPALVRREIDVAAGSDVVPDEVASLVRAHVRGEPLARAAQLVTRRRRTELRRKGGGAVVDIADDEVSVFDESRGEMHFHEIEVELVDGAPDRLLRRVVDRLEAAGAGRTEQMSKIARALGPRALAPPDVAVPKLGAHATARDVVAVAIASGFVRLLRHDPGVRLGGDPEDVHQARVAARRLRSDLRTFRSVLDAERTAPIREELKWLGAELGNVRDADVLLERLRHEAHGLPAADAPAAAALLQRLDDERTASRAELLTALDSPRYMALLDVLADAANDPPVNEDASASARKALPSLVRAPWKHLQRAVEHLGDHPADDALHELRIRAKRARYAAEAAAPVLGKPAARFAKALAALQGVLGDLQDAVVAEAWLRASGRRGTPDQALVAGELISAQRAVMQHARQTWPDAWHEVAGKKLRSFLA